MAADAQALQIIFIVSAAVSQWQNVVNKLCCLVPSLALAHLAKRMVADVPVPNSSPPLIITFVMVVATGKVLVVVLHQLAVVFAVAALVVSQLWAALVSAWPRRFHGHWFHLWFWAIKNLRGDRSRWRSFSIFLSCYHFSTLG